MLKVSLLSRFMALPRLGHLEQAIHILSYLNRHSRLSIVMDNTEPDLQLLATFEARDWTKYYPDAKDPIPTNMPEPRGKSVSTTCFVDVDHARCQVTRRSQTSIIIFCNRAPIIWLSKQQTTVESSTFGSESIAMKTAMDLIKALRYKLRMFGIPVKEPTSVLCDNQAIVRNTTMPESMLKRKHNSIA